MRDYDSTVKNLREAAKGLLFDAMPYRASVMRDAADAIEELLAKLTANENSGRLLAAAFDRLKSQVPHWISVEERLPEQYKPVIVSYVGYNTNSLFSDMVAYRDGDGDWCWWDGEFPSGEICKVKITHWMPLPEPPNGVE